MDYEGQELNLREIQIGEYNILKKIHDICTKLNLKYYLFYGTLLGAVRHEGFIPWDDDIDIIMPRDDYSVLIDYFINNETELKPLKLFHYRTNPEYIYPIARISDSRYSLVFNNTKEYGLGLFVDVYPLDGCGNTKKEAERIWKKNKNAKFWVGVYGINKFKKSTKSPLRSFLKFAAITVVKLMNIPKKIASLDHKASIRKFSDNKYVGCTAWEVSGLGYFKKELLDSSVLLKFEDSYFNAPSKYDEVLKETYGDYLKMPSEDNRIPHHEYRAFLKTKLNTNESKGDWKWTKKFTCVSQPI